MTLTHTSISLDESGTSQHYDHLRLSNGYSIDTHHPFVKGDAIVSAEHLIVNFDALSVAFQIIAKSEVLMSWAAFSLEKVSHVAAVILTAS